jgi:hypothetical protein
MVATKDINTKACAPVGRGVLPRSARFPASFTTSLVRPGAVFALPQVIFDEKDFDR